MPVPKKRSKGVCRTDKFQGNSLVSVVYKAMCVIVQERLVEERQLLAQEQGGFRRGRGCRDQILTLALLGQNMMTRSKKGMFAAFIDFKKAYDRVDRSKLWGCLEGFGLEGRMVGFLGAAYMECKCEVKVGDMVSESFGVGKGLRQGNVLSPMLFSLYINSLIDRLRGAEIEVKCKD